MTQFMNTLLYINYFYVYISIILTAFAGLLIGFNKKIFGVNLFLVNTLVTIIISIIASSIPTPNNIFSLDDLTILESWSRALADKTNTILVLFIGILFVNLLLRLLHVMILRDLKLALSKPVESIINSFIHNFTKDEKILVMTKNIIFILAKPVIGLLLISFSFTYVQFLYSVFI